MRFALDDDDRRPKIPGRFLGLWDGPLHRDWLAWVGASFTLIVAWGSAFPSDPQAPTSSLPRWLDGTLATLVAGVLFGLLPAYMRLRLRRRRRRKERAEGRRIDTTAGEGAGTSDRPTSQPASASAAPSVTELHPRQALPRSEESVPLAISDAADSETPRASHAVPDLPPPVLPTEVHRPRAPLPPTTPHVAAADAPPSALAVARETLPYPIARAARAVQLATEPMDAYRALLRCSEATAIVLGVTATAWARQHGVLTKELRALHDAYLQRGVSQGHWLDAARSLERPMSTHSEAPPGMAEAMRARKGAGGLLADLKDLLHERNSAAHGGEPHDRMEAAERNDRLRPLLERSLNRASFLNASPWVVTRSTRYRRREGDFEVVALRAMSDHPDFEVVTLITAQPLAEEVFYLLTPTATIDLTPLIVLRHCALCRQAEVAYADRLDKTRGVSLKTFDRGHALFDTDLSDDVQHLFSPPNDSANTGA